jgi:hypothetical protein
MANHRGLTIEELDAGLRMLNEGEIAGEAFWAANLATFRHALIEAAADTSDFLLAKQLSVGRRQLMEAQLLQLRDFIRIVDHLLAGGKKPLRRLN